MGSGILFSFIDFGMSRAIKRSHSGRSFCSVLRFQSVVPPSVSAHLFTHSLPSFGSCSILKKSF